MRSFNCEELLLPKFLENLDLWAPFCSQKSSRDDADILQLEQQLQGLPNESTRFANRVEESISGGGHKQLLFLELHHDDIY